MTMARETAHAAYAASLRQLELLRAGDFDAYASTQDEFGAIYRELLEIPLADFDAESAATAIAVADLHTAICEALEHQLDNAADALAASRRRKAVHGAYGIAIPSGDTRSI